MNPSLNLSMQMQLPNSAMLFMADSHSSTNFEANADKRVYQNGKPGWFWPLILLLLIVGWLWYYLKCCSNIYGGSKANTEQIDSNTHSGSATHDAGNIDVKTSATTGELDANNNFVINTGTDKTFTLANGTIITAGENSTEAKLISALNDKEGLASKDKGLGWITLDRVYFETGKSVLTAESQKQLDNIAAILKNYSGLTIKMGGYTDNTGPIEVNKKVSASRAQVAASELTKLGINGNEIKSEGYGPEHPICEANDTDACKAQNRRVDIRVNSK